MSTPTPAKKHSMKPMIIDGALYAAVAVLGALNTSFGAEEAAKYVTPEHLFWCKTVTGAVGSGALALKMFRSTTYAEHRTAVDAEDAQTQSPSTPLTPTDPLETH